MEGKTITIWACVYMFICVLYVSVFLLCLSLFLCVLYVFVCVCVCVLPKGVISALLWYCHSRFLEPVSLF